MKKLVSLCFLLLSFPLSSAFATDFYLTADRGGLKNQAVSEGDAVKIYLDQRRSYECYIQQAVYQGGSEFFGFADTATSPIGALFIVPFSPLGQKFVYTGQAHPVMSAPPLAALDPSFGTSDPQLYRGQRSRFAALPDVSGMYTFPIDGLLNVGGTASVDINCVTTSLVGKFNRFSADIVIVEIAGNGPSFGAGSVYLKDLAGNIIASDVIIFGAGRRDYIYSNLPSDAIGKIVINHSAPKGSLQASVAQYNVDTSGNLTLVSRLPLEQGVALP